MTVVKKYVDRSSNPSTIPFNSNEVLKMTKSGCRKLERHAERRKYTTNPNKNIF